MSTSTLSAPRRQRRARWVGPLILMAFQILGTFGAAHGQTDARAPDALAVLILAAGPLALVFVRTRPRQVLGFVTAITFAYVALGYPYGPVFASFVGATLVNIVLGYRIWAWGALAAAFVLAGIARLSLHDEPWSWGWAAGVLAWELVIVAVGELVRVRRASAAEAYRARQEAARRRAGEERLRIARELHDVVAHHMSLINVQAGVALHLVDRKPEQVESALVTIKDASREAMNELRSLIGVLRADGENAPLMPVATLSSMDDLVARTAQAGVRVMATVDGDSGALPPAVELAAFRIIQEAITNIVRHSGSRTARVTVAIRSAAVDIRVEDDGVGLGHGEREATGNGIRGMRERAQTLGGTLDIVPGPNAGTIVHAWLPCGRPT